jgi:hypothetical protein
MTKSEVGKHNNELKGDHETTLAPTISNSIATIEIAARMEQL